MLSVSGFHIWQRPVIPPAERRRIKCVASAPWHSSDHSLTEETTTDLCLIHQNVSFLVIKSLHTENQTEQLNQQLVFRHFHLCQAIFQKKVQISSSGTRFVLLVGINNMKKVPLAEVCTFSSKNVLQSLNTSFLWCVLF